MSTKPTPLAAMLEDLAAELVRLKEENARLRAALADCVPYVECAYECAFPDEFENTRVLEAARSALEGK